MKKAPDTEIIHFTNKEIIDALFVLAQRRLRKKFGRIPRSFEAIETRWNTHTDTSRVVRDGLHPMRPTVTLTLVRRPEREPA